MIGKNLADRLKVKTFELLLCGKDPRVSLLGAVIPQEYCLGMLELELICFRV